MLGKNIKELIIVCDNKTEKYGNYLRQLVSVNDDNEDEIIGTEDGTVDAVVWLEKDYLANHSKISSNQHVLFIGENKTSKKEISSMDVKFDKFGMKYGWLGKRGMMLVRENSLVPNEYDEFIDFCIGYQKEFEKVSLKGVTSKAIALSIAVSLIPVVGPIVGMTGLGAMSSLKIFN